MTTKVSFDLIDPVGESGQIPIVYDTVADMVAGGDIANALIQTKGYYTSGDGGGGEYLILSGVVPNDANKIAISSGNTAVLNASNTANLAQVGVLPQQGRNFGDGYLYDATQDYTAKFQAALTDGLNVVETLGGQYNFTDGMVFKHNSQSITMSGITSTELFLDCDLASNQIMWSTDLGTTASGFELAGFLCRQVGAVGTSQHIDFTDPYVPNAKLHDFKSIGFDVANSVHSWVFQFERITASGFNTGGHRIVGTSATMNSVWAADATCYYGFRIQLNYSNVTGLIAERITGDCFRVERDFEFDSRIQGLELNIGAEDCNGRFLYVNSDRSIIKVQSPALAGANPADYIVRCDAGEVIISDFEPNHFGAVNFTDDRGAGTVYLDNKTPLTQLNAQPHFETQTVVGLQKLNTIMHSNPWSSGASTPDYRSVAKYNGIYKLLVGESLTLRMFSPAGSYRGDGISLTVKCRTGISSSPQIATGTNCDVWLKTYNAGSGNVSLLSQIIPYGTDTGGDIGITSSTATSTEVTAIITNNSTYDIVYIELDGISPQYLLSPMIIQG